MALRLDTKFHNHSLHPYLQRYRPKTHCDRRVDKRTDGDTEPVGLGESAGTNITDLSELFLVN